MNTNKTKATFSCLLRHPGEETTVTDIIFTNTQSAFAQVDFLSTDSCQSGNKAYGPADSTATQSPLGSL